mmetsp:Transcript_59631/g.122294  ORF Transcript_59631/g.122294 Transcript_59631/m.122294 type:complete len:370 (+) Transcript_59631:679-1788(+)
MRESGGGGGIGQVVSGHVDGLHGGDGTLLVGGDTLLEHTQIGGKSGLVSDSGRDAAEQGRHLRVSLGEAEDVVDEKEHVLALLVTEILGDSETSQRHTSARTGRLVHLSVHEGSLGSRAIELDHTGLDHLVVELVTLTGALTDTGKDGVSSVSLGDVVDQLHDEHSLADTGTPEKSDLSSLGIWRQEIHDLDTSHQDLGLRGLLGESGRLSMDGHLSLGIDGATLIDGLTNHVDDATQKLGTSRHHDGSSGVKNRLTTHKTLRGVHCNSSHGVLSKMLRNLENEADVVILNFQGVQNGGKLAIKLNVNNGTDNLGDLSHATSGAGALIAEETLLNGCDPSLRDNWRRRPPLGREARSDAGQRTESRSSP